jgi:hypothetical protein
LPDKRTHRGAHPEDRKLFAETEVPRLRRAVADLSWLLGRGYSDVSALKLVGDRYSLRQRQRVAVMRCACADSTARDRLRRRCEPHEVRGQPIQLDGYNVLTTVEAALAGGVLLLGRDGCLRDMASMHGSFRKVQETTPGATLLGEVLSSLGVGLCTWLLDGPVSNSGRLKTLLQQIAQERQWDWRVQVVPSPDRVLAKAQDVIATADSAILDRCGRWFNLAWWTVTRRLVDAPILDLSGDDVSRV